MPIVRHKVFVDSTVTEHMVKNESMTTGKQVLFDAIIGTAGKGIIKSKAQSESVLNVSGGTKPARLNCFLHVRNVRHSWLSVSSLCDDCHKVEFSEKKWVVQKNGNVTTVGERMSGIYPVNLLGVFEKAMKTTEVSKEILMFRNRYLRIPTKRFFNE